MKKMVYFTISLFLLSGSLIFAQNNRQDKGRFIEYKNEFFENIQKGIDDFNKQEVKPNLTFKMDYSGINLPKSADEFKQQWHNAPVSQGNTGTCWCFSTTSYLESEAYRINKKKFKLSEMFTVYWEYVEKARRFVQERGNSLVDEGSQANATLRIWKKYGCVPEELYTGLKTGQKYYDHSKLITELHNYLNYVKSTSNWNEAEVLATVRSILNYHIGEPPAYVEVDGKKITPVEYLLNVVKIHPDEYVDIYSILEKPYFAKVEYEVPDNWWHNSDYYNVPLDDYMNAFKSAIKKGYTMCIGGDVSESGIESHAGVAMIPSYDIPSQYIDENAREFRFSNKTTTDDHGIHVVGYTEKDKQTWFLIKDSGSGSRNHDSSKGYYYFHEDYIKLKMMYFMVHRSAVEDILSKFKV